MKRKTMKEKLSWLLALCLLAQSFTLPVFAETKAPLTEAAITQAAETADAGPNAEAPASLPFDQDCVEGDVIVCVTGGRSALSEALSGGLLGAPEDGASFGGFTIEEVLAEFPARGTSEEGIEEVPAIAAELLGNGSGAAKETEEILLLHTNDTEEAVEKLSRLPFVKYAQPNYVFSPESCGGQDEPFYPFQWGLSNPDEDADIGAEKAWEQSSRIEPEKPLVVAVMDSGVDYTHPDLAPVMWDDGLLYPELTALGGGRFGLNTSGEGDTDDPMDVSVGHGTHCASVIASAWNGEGTAGVNGRAQIMAMCWMGSKGGSNANYIKACRYVMAAKEAGVNVRITNNSWGTAGRFVTWMPALIDIVARMSDAGIISVFASGNANQNMDGEPAVLTAPPELYVSVDAADSTGKKAGFSNYGKFSTDVFAPGVNILAAASTSPGAYSMPAQYLPWTDLSAEENLFYCDMEGDVIPVAAQQWLGPPKASPSIATPSTIQPAVTERQHRGNEKNRVLSFDVELTLDEEEDEEEEDPFAEEEGEPTDEFMFDIALELSAEQKEKLASFEEFYLSFEIDREGDVLSYDDTGFLVSVWDHRAEQFVSVDEATKGIFIDSRWNYAAIRLGEMNLADLCGGGNVIRIRLCTVSRRREEGTGTFYLDNIGIGTAPGQYTYASGTSMACPAASGVLSLILEKLIAESAGTEKTACEIAKEAIALLKGGAIQREGLFEYCITSGMISAENSLTGNVSPVVNELAENEDGTVTIGGYFFGSEKGTVTCGGETLPVSSWSDRVITAEAPGGTGRLSEIAVTAASGKRGRNFFKIGKSGEPSYEELPAPPFLSPWNCICGTNGTILCFAETGTDGAESQVTVWKYDIRKKNWNEVPYPGEKISFMVGLPYETQVAAGKTEIYLLAGQYEFSDDGQSASSVGRLLTFDTVSGTWKYDVEVKLEDCGQGTLCIHNGELLLLDGAQEPAVYRIYPDTGEFDKCSMEMPEEVAMGSAFSVDGDILLSGALNGIMYVVLDGIFPGFAMFREIWRYHQKDSAWSASETVFFGKGSEIIDQNTWHQSSAVPLKDGLMIVGPVAENGKEGFADTWRYHMDSDTYEKYPACFDAVRTRNVSSCLVDGTMYVLGVTGSAGYGETMKFSALDIRDIAHEGYPDVKKSKDPPVPDPDPDPREEPEERPAFTGTWGAPVTNGRWSQGPGGSWYYTTNGRFRNTWGYIENPYAGEGRNKADWFWFAADGRMLTGWQLIDGRWYYLNPVPDGTLGACFIGPGKTPDGWEVDASGAWTGR